MSAETALPRRMAARVESRRAPGRHRGWRLAAGLGTALGAAVMLLPLLATLSNSFKTPTQFFAVPPEWIPNPLILTNYELALTKVPFLLYVSNTLAITVPAVVGQVLSSTLVGYA